MSYSEIKATLCDSIGLLDSQMQYDLSLQSNYLDSNTSDLLYRVCPARMFSSSEVPEW